MHLTVREYAPISEMRLIMHEYGISHKTLNLICQVQNFIAVVIYYRLLFTQSFIIFNEVQDGKMIWFKFGLWTASSLFKSH